MDRTAVDLCALILRIALGTVMLAHGWNHLFRGGRLPGVARWFASLGFRAPRLQAALASYTEIGIGPLLVVGALTPLAAAGVVGVMLVAFVANHRKNGYFVFRPGEGYEYVLTLLLAALALGALGAGRCSVDDAIGLDVDGWAGLAVAGVIGGGMGAATLALFWRPGASRRQAAA
jgi:putative oxidoreductase